MESASVGDLWAKVCDAGNLRLAWARVEHKRARGGIDGVTVAEFGKRLEQNLAGLRRDLLEGRYVPEPAAEIAIPKPGKPGETRALGMHAVRDKLVQHAVKLVIEPLLERRFLDCSYGYRPGKGPVRAIGRVRHHLQHLGHRFVVLADIDEFFPSLDHGRLLAQLRQVVEAEPVMRLVEIWLRMGVVDGRGRWKDVQAGVTQGSVLSPLLANAYLQPFDAELVSAGHGLIRYADDLLITAPTEARAQEALSAARHGLDDLGLRLNDTSGAVIAAEAGFSFLGVRFEAGGLAVPREKVEEARGRVARLGRWAGRDPKGALAQAAELVRGWVGYYGRLVQPDALASLDEATTEGARVLSRALLASGRLKAKELRAHLAALPSLIPRTPAERDQWAGAIVSAGPPPYRASPSPPPAALRAAVGLTAPDSPAACDPGAPAPAAGASPQKVVRSRKRRHDRVRARVSRLVVVTPGSFVGKASQRVVVRRERRCVLEVPAQTLEAVSIAATGVSLSTDVVTLCADNSAPLLVLDGRGRLTASLAAPRSASGSLPLAQVRIAADGSACLALAKAFVRGKMLNQLSLMKSLAKYRRGRTSLFLEQLTEYKTILKHLLDDLRGVAYEGDLPQARSRAMSIEGRAAQRYWSIFAEAVRARAAFTGREGHGAQDVVNSLLNYGYAVLQGRAFLALLEAGLMPEVAFLHSPQHEKPVLAFDLMEEFRPVAVDRVVLTMLARREPAEVDDHGLLTPATRSRLLRRLDERFATLLRYRSRELSLADALRFQARALAAHVRGERRYRPFAMRW